MESAHSDGDQQRRLQQLEQPNQPDQPVIRGFHGTNSQQGCMLPTIVYTDTARYSDPSYCFARLSIIATSSGRERCSRRGITDSWKVDPPAMDSIDSL